MTDNKKTATQKIFLSVLYSVIVGVVISWSFIMVAHHKFILSNFIGLFIPNFIMAFCCFLNLKN